MDALAHMLSDALDPKEENHGQITEECLLGNTVVSLPEDLLEDVSFRRVCLLLVSHVPINID